MKVFLDDERQTPEGWERTKTVEDTIILLKTGNVTELSLDHDLGEEDVDGYEVLKWLEEQVYFGQLEPPKAIYIHSANPPARQRMEAAVEAIQRLSDAS